MTSHGEPDVAVRCRSWPRSGPVFVVAIVLGLQLARGQDPPPVYPDKHWDLRTPAEAGLDSAALDAFAEAIQGRGCVVRNGFLAYTWGDASKRGDVASAAKPWYTHFLFVAFETGRIPSLDEPVVRRRPDLTTVSGGNAITWRHLANQISCYGVSEEPGTAYDYSDYQMALFFDLLFLDVYKSSWDRVDAEVLHPLLTVPLQCEDAPTFMAFGSDDRPGRLALSPRDFARFGLLYLRGGLWRDRRLLEGESVRTATRTPLPNTIPRTAGEKAAMLPNQRSIGGGANQTDHRGSYSFAWWLNGPTREGPLSLPDAPRDIFACFGHGGPRALVVFPALDLIVSWNDAKIDGWEQKNNALRRLLAAVRTPDPQ